MSPIEIMKLPKEERDRIFEAAAKAAEKEYGTNSDLTDFDAFGQEDLLDG